MFYEFWGVVPLASVFCGWVLHWLRKVFDLQKLHASPHPATKP